MMNTARNLVLLIFTINLLLYGNVCSAHLRLDIKNTSASKIIVDFQTGGSCIPKPKGKAELEHGEENNYAIHPCSPDKQQGTIDLTLSRATAFTEFKKFKIIWVSGSGTPWKILPGDGTLTVTPSPPIGEENVFKDEAEITLTIS